MLKLKLWGFFLQFFTHLELDACITIQKSLYAVNKIKKSGSVHHYLKAWFVLNFKCIYNLFKSHTVYGSNIGQVYRLF